MLGQEGFWKYWYKVALGYTRLPDNHIKPQYITTLPLQTKSSVEKSDYIQGYAVFQQQNSNK